MKNVVNFWKIENVKRRKQRLNVVPMSGDGTEEELTRFSREDGQKSVRRDTADLTAEALDSI